MKASKFTDVRKAFVIKQGVEGTPIVEICRKAGISQATYVNWQKKYRFMDEDAHRAFRRLIKRGVSELQKPLFPATNHISGTHHHFLQALFCRPARVSRQ